MPATRRTRRTRRQVTLAFAVGLGLRVLVGQLLPVAPSWDGVIYERAARQLADGRGYTQAMYDPEFEWAYLPTAFYPPGWPATLSLLKRLADAPRLDLLLQALIGALVIPIAARFGGAYAGHGAARRAAWLVALWPGGWLTSASWMGEPLFTLAVALALLPLVGRPSTRRASLSALLLGAAAYVRPTALIIAPFALVARASAGRHPRSRAALALPIAALALVPVAPWMARNADRLSAPVLASNAGANLYVGTLGARYREIPEAVDCPHGPRELTRDRCRRDRALRRIADEPLRWLALGLGKVLHTFGYEMGPALQAGAGLGWSPPEARPQVQALIAICSLYWLGLLLFAARSRGRSSVRRVVVASALAVAALHFVFLGGDRYHLPLVPLVAALAAAAPPATRSRG